MFLLMEEIPPHVRVHAVPHSRSLQVCDDCVSKCCWCLYMNASGNHFHWGCFGYFQIAEVCGNVATFVVFWSVVSQFPLGMQCVFWLFRSRIHLTSLHMLLQCGRHSFLSPHCVHMSILFAHFVTMWQTRPSVTALCSYVRVDPHRGQESSLSSTMSLVLGCFSWFV